MKWLVVLAILGGIAFAVSGMASGTNEWDQAHGARRLTLLDDAGQPVRFDSPDDALSQGIAMVHQELMPIPDLNVAENLLLGMEPVNALGWVDRADREAHVLGKGSKRRSVPVGSVCDVHPPGPTDAPPVVTSRSASTAAKAAVSASSRSGAMVVSMGGMDMTSMGLAPVAAHRPSRAAPRAPPTGELPWVTMSTSSAVASCCAQKVLRAPPPTSSSIPGT